MRIVACVKAVPASTEVKMDPETNTIVRDGGAAVLNPFDTAALEIALQIAEGRRAARADHEGAAEGAPVPRGGADRTAARADEEPAAQVSVLSMGIPATEELLRDCIARGADRAALLTDRAFAGADTLATTHALACGIGKLGGADLVLCGKMAVDGDTAQIGPELAGALGASCLADVREVVAADADGVVARCGVDGGTALLAAPYPVVLTVAKEAAQLRMPSIEGVLAAEAAASGGAVPDVPGRPAPASAAASETDAACALHRPGEAPAPAIEMWSASDVGADPARIGLAGSPTQVVRTFVPERADASIEVVGNTREQAARLLDILGGEA